jgi:hypothetical protein
LNETKQEPKPRYDIFFKGCAAIEALALIVSVLFAVRGGVGALFLLFILLQLLTIPLMLTFGNIALIFVKPEPDWKPQIRFFEFTSALIGFVLSALELSMSVRYADWNAQIVAGEHPSPILLQSVPTALSLFLIGVAGYFILAFTHAKKTPPLVTILAISALCIGVFECALWSVQAFKVEFLLMILPINFIIIAARLVRDKALEFGGGNFPAFGAKKPSVDNSLSTDGK